MWLLRGYSCEAELGRLAEDSGASLAQLPVKVAAQELARELLKEAACGGHVQQLLHEVLADPGGGAIHAPLRALLGQPEPDVGAAMKRLFSDRPCTSL